jgi:hypothetical protein
VFKITAISLIGKSQKRMRTFGRSALLETTGPFILQNQQHLINITDLLVACWVERRTFCERITSSFGTQSPEEQKTTITHFPSTTLS